MYTQEDSGLILSGAQAITRVVLTMPEQYVVVNVGRQIALCVSNSAVMERYPISTSRYGIGNAEGSQQTPLGVHRIAAKYGFGAPCCRIFRDRIDTGETWRPEMGNDDFVLTRILWLQGLEDGLNRGAGIDSFDRYIYIHGIANEAAIGKPWSHGCVCMRNQDAAAFFDSVSEGTIVVITQ